MLALRQWNNAKKEKGMIHEGVIKKNMEKIFKQRPIKAALVFSVL